MDVIRLALQQLHEVRKMSEKVCECCNDAESQRLPLGKKGEREREKRREGNEKLEWRAWIWH